jgi:RNA polymerase sigma factor (sigma-70 family)
MKMSPMTDDADLLRAWAEERSERAFTELVQRHLRLVHAVALRQVGGNTHLAEDIVQQVFLRLAQNAGTLTRHPVISGWLHRTTRYVAIDTLRREQRRRAREQEAELMNKHSTPPAADGDALRPVLDEAIAELDARDRDAVLLRFFENRPFAEIGVRLSLTENAARMRVDRALAKLSDRLARRGITSTTTALAAALAPPVGATPAGLAATVVSGVVASGGGTTATTLIPLLAMTKIQSGAIAALLATAVGLYFHQARLETDLTSEVAALRRDERELLRLRAENRRLESIAREIASYRDDGPALARIEEEAKVLISRAVAGVTGPVFALSELDQAPAPTQQTGAVYPPELKRAGISGSVTLGFVVNSNGKVLEPTVVSSTHPLFEEAAIAAIQGWIFQPGAKSGNPVNARMQVPFSFRLAAPSEKGPAPSGAPVVWPWFPQ